MSDLELVGVRKISAPVASVALHPVPKPMIV